MICLLDHSLSLTVKLDLEYEKALSRFKIDILFEMIANKG